MFSKRWFLLIARRVLQIIGCSVVALALVASASATKTTAQKKARHVAASSNHHSSASASHSSKKHGVKTAKGRSRGQRGIDEDRTRAIQEALIREHYLDGEPTGQWNQSTRDALIRFQAANGWQTKITPDSRALIKLGLGPDKTGLLNPETAAIGAPHEMGTGDAQPGGSADQQ